MTRLNQMDAQLPRDILGLTRNLISTHDVDYLLSEILGQARKMMRAEAGSIYLRENETLRLMYAQNDRVTPTGGGSQYVGLSMPVDPGSLAGYVAATGRDLLIDDAYAIDPAAPYHFNPERDRASGFRSRSMLVTPMHSGEGRVLGVLQLINHLDGQGLVVPFSRDEADWASFYANSAVLVVERAIMTRELILRTIRMAQLRDPKETGTHVNRVGGYSSLIYQALADRQGLGGDEVKKNMDLIRVAAMLHDVGKVAISDAILKKPGRLSDGEYNAMKLHTVLGARLFANPVSQLDELSRDIALRHHERWEGGGYPGRVEDLQRDPVVMGDPMRGSDIPEAALIVALADVYDALGQQRVYKEPWPEEKVLKIIREGRGTHFAPRVVDAFFDCYPDLQRVRKRYEENAAV